MQVILNAARLWTEYSLEQKQRLQEVLFPQGVQFLDGSFRTAVTCLIFSMLQQSEAQKERMATQKESSQTIQIILPNLIHHSKKRNPSR